MQSNFFQRPAAKRLALGCAALLAVSTLIPLAAHADPQPAAGKDRAVAAAAQLVRNQLQSDSSSLELTNAQLGDGQKDLYYVTYKRTVDGKRVVGGETIVVATGEGVVTDVSKQELSQLPRKVEASISAADAVAKAKSLLSKVDEATEAELVVYADGVPATSAYRVEVFGQKVVDGQTLPSYQVVYVNAADGNIVFADELAANASANGFHNGKISLDISGSDMISGTAKGVKCGDQQTMPLKGRAPFGNGEGKDHIAACADVLYAAENEHKMLKEWLGRDGMDGRGNWLPAYVDLNDVNAYYNGRSTNFGWNKTRTNMLTSMDVVAHEYGHGIFIYSGSAGNNGGVAESAADIFGALTEHYANNAKDTPDYLVGESANIGGDGKTLVRNMYDPSQVKNHPNCYSNAIPNTEVHAAAGPLNHWFYLLAEGSNPGGGKPSSPTCNGATISSGIGIKDAGRIAYGAMMRRTDKSYAAMRSYALAAAKDLFPGSCEKFNATKAAFEATSFPAQSGEPTCTETNPTKPPTTKPTAPKPPADGGLANGTSVDASVKAGEQREFFVTMPANAKNLKITMSGNNGDADLYVKYGEKATYDAWDCRPFLSGSAESCTVEDPQEGKYYIMVDGATAATGVKLVATWTAGEE